MGEEELRKEAIERSLRKGDWCCRTCVFWNEMELCWDDKRQHVLWVGTCHRYPPSILLPTDIAKSIGGEEIEVIWPDTAFHDFCGEWAQKLKVENWSGYKGNDNG